MKRIKYCILVLLFWMSSLEISAQDRIEFRVIKNETLEVSGTGEFDDIPSSYSWKPIKKLVVKDGITSISAEISTLEKLEEVDLPNSLVEIESYAFEECERLREIVIPDSVKRIGDGAFDSCKRLSKIVLPASMQQWDTSIIEGCSSLKRIENRSGISCDISWNKKYVTWKVNKKKISTIPPHKTAIATGKKIPITYRLNGGSASRKLPAYYRYGNEVKLPRSVKKAGYKFMGWCTYTGEPVDTVGPKKSKAKVYANWYKYKMASKKRGQVTIRFDASDSWTQYEEHIIRYSVSKDMKRYKEKFISKKKGKVTIKGLEPGRTYYFEISGLDDYNWDVDSDYRRWMGRGKVAVHV
nr:leucine-rich repeat protein [Eubacterium sp.]